MKQYTAAVIGLGKSGQGFDYLQPDDSVITTHASGYVHHAGYRLLAAVDPDPAQREKFARKFRRPAYADVPAMMAQHQPEIFSITVPTDLHLAVFQEIIRYRPQAVICEKPIAASTADGRLMQSLADNHQCVLAVNYMRRFEPGAIALKKIIQDQELGTIFKGVVWYSKGILNSASHFIDILHYWLGDVTGVNILKRGRRWEGIDPEPDFSLHFGDAPVYFLGGLEEYYSVGEIDLFATGGVIRYTQSGNRIEISRSQAHPIYAEYTILNPEAEIINTDLKRYQWHVLEGLYNHMNSGMGLNSDGRSAIKTLEVVENVLFHLDRRQDE